MGDFDEKEVKMGFTTTETLITEESDDFYGRERNIRTSITHTSFRTKTGDGEIDEKLDGKDRISKTMMDDSEMNEGLRLIEQLGVDIDIAMNNVAAVPTMIVAVKTVTTLTFKLLAKTFDFKFSNHSMVSPELTIQLACTVPKTPTVSTHL